VRPNEVEIPKTRPDSETDKVPQADPLTAARDAFRKEDYVLAASLTRDQTDQSEACLLHIRALANLGDPETARLARQAIERHPLQPELYYLLAHLHLLDANHSEAILLLRKAIFLAPSLVMAHFMLATVLQRSGDRGGAQRHFRNAIELSEALPVNEIIPMSEGQPAAVFAAAARRLLRVLISEGTK